VSECEPEWSDRASVLILDTAVGGRDFDAKLALFIRQAAEKKLKTNLDTPRVNARLRKEAKRVKEVLSANTEMHLSIENLTPSDDFFLTITRSEFETLCAELFERSYAPVAQALASANISAVCTRAHTHTHTQQRERER
jgi:molecular chaperone DnaK (HSP70)